MRYAGPTNAGEAARPPGQGRWCRRDALAQAIDLKGYAVSTAELRDATSRHPAFWTKDGHPAIVGVGRPAVGPQRVQGRVAG